MSKSWIEVDGRLYDLGMAVEVIPEGPHGLCGYHVKFCNGSSLKFTIREADRLNGDLATRNRYNTLVETANEIRKYLFDRTIRVVPGPFRSDRHEDY